MESPDVSIVYCEDAAKWCDSLYASLMENFELNIHKQSLEELVLPLTPAKIGFFLRIKAQVVIVTDDLLKYLQNNPEAILGRIFDPSRVAGLMCGVDDSDIQTAHRANLIEFENWKKIDLNENPEEGVMTMLKWIGDTVIEDTVPSDDCAESTRQKARFKLHPNKVREGFSKVFIETLDAMPEGHTISCTIETDCESIPLKTERSNPYTVKIVLPDRFFGVSQIVNVTVKCGMESLGSRPLKCESKMYQMNHLLETIIDPLSFMCQTLGLATNRTEDLDHRLTKIFKKNIPATGFSVMDISADIDRQKVDEELPTLLHFASKMGLKELSSVLLDCPGGEAACRLRNSNGHTPSDLAEMAGHSCLAGLLESYSSMSEAAEIYIYMQRMAEDVNNENYENLRTTFRRSVEVFQFSENPSHASPDEPEIFERNETICQVDVPPANARPLASTSNFSNREGESTECQPETRSKGLQNLHLYGQGQQELLQLLEDFKKERYSIGEVELLFQNWQTRQNSRSFHEKQEQLKDLRQQYEQIQKKCTEVSRKKSALERFRSMLMLNVKKENVKPVQKPRAVYKRERKNEDVDVSPTIRLKGRPHSSISCSSRSSHGSSSSSRSSTMSATSDSGTLSDIGEERNGNRVSKWESKDGPKSLQRPLVPRMIENKQYMYSSRPRPPVPPKKPTPKLVVSLPAATESSVSTSRGPKSASPKSVSPKFPKQDQLHPKLVSSKSCKISTSIEDRKPMPPPRIITGTLSQTWPDLFHSQLKESRSPNFESQRPPRKNSEPRKMSLSAQGSVSPRKMSLSAQGSVSPKFSSSPDGYLLMDSPRRRPSATPAPASDETDYYNMPTIEPHSEYIDMQSMKNLSDSLENQFPRSPSENFMSSYANMCSRANLSDPDRCDSVPEMVAPPLPVDDSAGGMPIPPPLPPRNPSSAASSPR